MYSGAALFSGTFNQKSERTRSLNSQSDTRAKSPAQLEAISGPQKSPKIPKNAQNAQKGNLWLTMACPFTPLAYYQNNDDHLLINLHAADAQLTNMHLKHHHSRRFNTQWPVHVSWLRLGTCREARRQTEPIGIRMPPTIRYIMMTYTLPFTITQLSRLSP